MACDVMRVMHVMLEADREDPATMRAQNNLEPRRFILHSATILHEIEITIGLALCQRGSQSACQGESPSHGLA